MKERAAMLGGALTFRQATGRGTVVELEVPLERVATPGAERALP
jgi:nitrate/nitrite-specific signal transduction histidine kinase